MVVNLRAIRRWAAVVCACGLAQSAVAQLSVPPEASSAQPQPIELDAAVIDRYAGSYQMGGNVLLTITRVGNQLFAQLTGQPHAEIYAQSEREFFYKVVRASISFQSDAQGRTTGLVLHQNGADLPAPRIDAATAQQINAAIGAKIRSQSATPGSDAALRRLIEGIRTGEPNYADMSPQFQEVTRRQLPQLQAAMAQLGAVQAVEFRGVGNQGWDLYAVKQARGSTQWKIALDAEGIITGALVSVDP